MDYIVIYSERRKHGSLLNKPPKVFRESLDAR